MSIIEIAKVAGVSKSTVSRVLNAPETVKPELVRKVRAAMKSCAYVQPAVKRGPKPRATARPGRKEVIGFLLLGRTRELLAHPYLSKVMGGMVELLSDNGLHLTVIEAPDLSRFPSIITNREVDGLLVTGHPPTPALVDRLHPIPCVWQGGVELDIPIVDHVIPNSRVIARLAADYLLARGCRRPALLNHDPYHPTFGLRWTLFAEHLAKAGITARLFQPEPVLRNQEDPSVVDAALWSATALRDGLAKQVDRMLAEPERPDGLFIPTDQSAAMVWSLLRERGVIPGRDLITVSVNNDAAWMDTMHPRPATIDPGAEEMGRESARRLLARIERPHDDPVTVIVTPKLVKGE